MYLVSFLSSIFGIFIKYGSTVKPMLSIMEKKLEDEVGEKLEDELEKLGKKLEEDVGEKLEEKLVKEIGKQLDKLEEEVEEKLDGKDFKDFKGTHIFADYKGLFGNEYEIGEFIFQLMQDSILNASTMKIVHKNLVILNKDTQGVETPPGFTEILALLQLDSSHMTCTSFTSNPFPFLQCISVM